MTAPYCERECPKHRELERESKRRELRRRRLVESTRERRRERRRTVRGALARDERGEAALVGITALSFRRPLRLALEQVFPELALTVLGDPLGDRREDAAGQRGVRRRRRLHLLELLERDGFDRHDLRLAEHLAQVALLGVDEAGLRQHLLQDDHVAPADREHDLLVDGAAAVEHALHDREVCS